MRGIRIKLEGDLDRKYLPKIIEILDRDGKILMIATGKSIPKTFTAIVKLKDYSIFDFKYDVRIIPKNLITFKKKRSVMPILRIYLYKGQKNEFKIPESIESVIVSTKREKLNTYLARAIYKLKEGKIVKIEGIGNATFFVCWLVACLQVHRESKHLVNDYFAVIEKVEDKLGKRAKLKVFIFPKQVTH